MSQEGRGCLVGDQGGSDKVAQFKNSFSFRQWRRWSLILHGIQTAKLLFSVIIRCALLKLIKTSNNIFVCLFVCLLYSHSFRFLEAQHSPYAHFNMKQIRKHVKQLIK